MQEWGRLAGAHRARCGPVQSYIPLHTHAVIHGCDSRERRRRTPGGELIAGLPDATSGTKMSLRPARRSVLAGVLRGLPESGEGPAIRRLAQLLERPLANLANALARDAHQRADLLQRHRLSALIEAVVEEEDLPLAWREVLPEHASR